MAVNFNGSSKNAEMEYIDILLEGKSNEFKGRVLAFIRKYKIDAKDPTFMLLVALGGLDVALVDLPQAIAKGQQGMSEEIKRVESEFDEIWRTHSDLNLVNEKLDRVLTKVDYNATKLGRIEKHLGVKKPKNQ